MIAVTPVAAGNSRGGIAGGNWKRARARTGCPGIAASSTACSLSRLGRWLTLGCRKTILRIIFSESCSAASTGKCGTLRERCRTSTVVPLLLAAGRQDERSTKRCGARWLALRRICFWRAFCHGFARIRADKPSLSISLRQLLLRTCFRGASTAYCSGFTVSPQIIWHFALCSLMLAESFGHSGVQKYGDY